MISIDRLAVTSTAFILIACAVRCVSGTRHKKSSCAIFAICGPRCQRRANLRGDEIDRVLTNLNRFDKRDLGFMAGGST